MAFRSWSRRAGLAVCASLVFAACREPNVAALSPDTPRFSVTQVSQDPNPSQLEVAAVVPGFGGYFLDASGTPAVYLTDPGERPAAEAALAAFLVDRGFTASDLRVLPGDFEYTQLDAWYRQARPNAFQVAGIILGDVDEGHNRIRFG
ncbi:MAG: hypothetical protein ACREMN_02650, partial [Gemmatimonadales bacterium]